MHYTTVVDGCNVAYYGQNKEGGKFQISQVREETNPPPTIDGMGVLYLEWRRPVNVFSVLHLLAKNSMLGSDGLSHSWPYAERAARHVCGGCGS